jgi:hypothetical protein
MHRSTLVFLAVLVIFVILLIFAEWLLAPTFYQCFRQNEFARVVAYIQCSGAFVDRHGSGIGALATIVIAAFTGTLWVSTSRQAKLTREGIALAHPPKIIIRRVSLDEGSHVPVTGVGRATLWKIQYVIANIGGARATVMEGNATVVDIPGGQLPGIPPFDDREDFATSFSLAPGESHPFPLFLRENIINKIITNRMANDPGEIFFFGYMQYVDDVDLVRRTAFCRRFNGKTRRFELVTDSDYEYS